MADCYLRKEIGSNVFRKMKDPAQSRYFNSMSSYYDTAWKYGIGQNANATTKKKYGSGAAGSVSYLPIDAFDQNASSMWKGCYTTSRRFKSMMRAGKLSTRLWY